MDGQHSPEGQPTAEQTDIEEIVPGIDQNHDGRISGKEMHDAQDLVAVRIDMLLQRLVLERNILVMLWKLTPFLVCVLCFVAALCEFSPAGAVYKAHKHLITEFHLSSIADISDANGVYDYIEKFSHANEDLRATSMKYWCEDRYAVYTWDPSLNVPTWKCESPRSYALSLTGDANAKYSTWSATRRRAADPHPPSRLLSGTGSSGQATHSVPPCVDNDQILQSQKGTPGATCAGSAPSVCEVDLGIVACPSTCGFCAPFKYQPVKRFEKFQVALLPVVVFQTRFQEKECEEFAHTYEMQPYNPVLTVLPAMDGVRHGRVLTCVDRTKHFEGDYAFEIKCPDGSPAHFCPGGKMHHTEKHTFHGDTIYPKMLIEPHRDIGAMRAIEWIDVQTEEVTLSTMIYTEGVEIFTSLSVIFKIDDTGNVIGHHKMISYRDLVRGASQTFQICLVVCIILSFVSTVLSIVHMVRHPEDCNWGFSLYELMSRSILFAYPLVLIITWSLQKPMGKEYDELLHTFTNLESLDHDTLEAAVQSFFDVKTHIYEETNWLTRHRITATIVLYIQFVQLILYFSAHPKMGVLTSTVLKALDATLHFLLLFGVLFMMMAFMAHWMLGEHIGDFGTVGDTIQSQGRMIFGEFIYADGAENLHGAMVFAYWLYAFTFMIVVFFTLLNFFLAIVVDAFVDVKEEVEEQKGVGGFIHDVFIILVHYSKLPPSRWVTYRRLRKFLAEHLEIQESVHKHWLRSLKAEEQEEEDEKWLPSLLPQDFADNFTDFEDREYLANFLAYYHDIMGCVVCKKSADALPLAEMVTKKFEDGGYVKKDAVEPAQLGNTEAIL